MSAFGIDWRVYLFAGWVVTALFVHLRGRDRLSPLRQLTDHSTIMAPYNGLMYLFSAVPNKPVQDLTTLPDLAILKENWQTIRDEAMTLLGDGAVRAADSHNDLAFNSFFKHGWKRFYLKWYGDYMPSARDSCPRTIELLERVPGINAAMFTVLAPHSRLPSHRDPFAGSLRYHLGLKTPNSDRCRIHIDGEPYHWKDGEDILFDETYVHRVRNDTDEHRLILFCDVARPIRNPVVRAINRFVTHNLVKASASRNVETEHVGILNRLFQYPYKFRLLAKRVKNANKPLYVILKYALIFGLIWLVFFR